MKNQFSGVLRENKTGVEMGEKKKIKQSHCRGCGCGSHSGIFNACSCEIKGKIPELVSGSSTHVVIKQGNFLFNKQQTTRVEDPETSSGIPNFIMTNATRGFTLIELLVVVLIIGILAAVALPQYQKAVEKSKAAQAFSLLRTSYQAAESFFLSNGVWPQKVEDLDIDISWQQTTNPVPSMGDYARSNGDWALEMVNGSAFQGVLITRIDGKYKGGSFGIFHTLYGNTKAEHVQEMICMEQLQGDYAFGGQEGEYCTKLFHGTKFNRGSGQRFYYF